MTAHIPPPLVAGWYPDPDGQPGQRYYNGAEWTSHFTPYPPTIIPSVVVNNHVGSGYPGVAVAVSGGVNHGLHLLLTLVTCGVWLPIWIIMAILGGGRSVAVSGGSGNVVSPGRSRGALTVGAVFVGLFVLGLVAEHPWLLAILAPTVAAGAGLFYLNQQKHKRDQEADKLAARADYENGLHAEGDPRGTHGRFLPPEDLR